MPDAQTTPELPCLTASARLVAGALAEVHEATVAALHENAGVSKSTVAKTLVILERAGAARRTVRETNGVREADLWSPGPELGAVLFEGAAAASPYGHAASLQKAAEGADPQVLDMASESDSAIVLSVEEDAEPAQEGVSNAEDREAPSLVPDADVEATHAASRASDATEERSAAHGVRGRLASGGLGEMVAAALAAHPEIDYTPTMLSHLLQGRSAGAISNALERMCVKGTAVRVCDKPKRYRYAVGDSAGS